MKSILSIFMLMTGLSAWAQDAPVLNEYKPNPKNLTLEVNFNPFSSSPVSINYLRFRKFVTDRTAWRLSGTIGYKNQNLIEYVTQYTFDINLRPGYEWHFKGTERLSPYIGFDVDFALKASGFTDKRSIQQNQGPNSSISGAWDVNGTERGFTRFGSNLILGLDYYVIKKLYVGLEVGWGFQLVSSHDIVVTPRSASNQTISGGSVFQIGTNYNSAVRLGFVF
ncbi:MAG: hypothetical protein ACK5RG_11685 [Cyclobacteriaceae bacterium]|nr:hypothetical protein [Flammeovirgaceae bacterium]